MRDVLCCICGASQQTIEAMADKTQVFDELGKFDASKLKKTETKESNTLPTKESKCTLSSGSHLLVCVHALVLLGSLTHPLPVLLLQPLIRRRQQSEECAIVVRK